jgi:K+-transporting ATPase ATPase C chain
MMMLKQTLAMMKLFVVISLLVSCFYPLSLNLMANFCFPFQAQGSLIYHQHKVIGSILLGQKFHSSVYFSGRPSLTSYQSDEISPQQILLWPNIKKMPQDLPEMFYPSASMLDPNISWQAMIKQLPLVANARKIPMAELYRFVETHGLVNGLVNVFELNFAMDQEWKSDGKKA